MNKTKGLLWRAGFYPGNQSNLKNFLKSLIGWKIKADPSKTRFCFDYVNRLYVTKCHT